MVVFVQPYYRCTNNWNYKRLLLWNIWKIYITDSFLIIFVIFSNLNYFNCGDPERFNTWPYMYTCDTILANFVVTDVHKYELMYVCTALCVVVHVLGFHNVHYVHDTAFSFFVVVCWTKKTCVRGENDNNFFILFFKDPYFFLIMLFDIFEWDESLRCLCLCNGVDTFSVCWVGCCSPCNICDWSNARRIADCLIRLVQALSGHR